MLSPGIKRIISMMDGLISWNLLWSSICSFLCDPPDSAPFFLFPTIYCSPTLPFCWATLVFSSAMQQTGMMSCSDLRASSPEPCVSESVSVCVQHWSGPQSVRRPSGDWLVLSRVTWDTGNIRRVILADQTAATLQGPLIWLMLYREPCMRGREQRTGWFDTRTHLGSHCWCKLQEK